MPTYQRSVRVRAPLDEVWRFHSRADGLEAVTPSFLHLRVDAVRGPGGERDPDVLERGSRIDASIRPFGVGPRRRWRSVIVERERGDGSAYFADEMTDGPFPSWRHVHRFYADGDETLVVDRVEYELPAVGSLGPLGNAGFEPMFRHRHRRTRELLEK